jgi:hypothetical protein
MVVSWEQFRAGVRLSYTTKDLGPKLLHVGVPVAEDRVQPVVVSHVDNVGPVEWAHLDALIGHVNEVSVDQALELVGTVVCGGLAVLQLPDARILTVRHCVPLPDFNWQEFNRPVQVVAHAADEIRFGLPSVPIV